MATIMRLGLEGYPTTKCKLNLRNIVLQIFLHNKSAGHVLLSIMFSIFFFGYLKVLCWTKADIFGTPI